MTTASVIVRGACKSFTDRIILSNVDLTIREGEFVALVGASGSGKTTLMRLLSGLQTPDSGEILVPQKCTTVFQEPRLVQSSRVWQNVVLGMPKNPSTKDLALKALDEVGLVDQAHAWPATLSGGEAQRVAIARALVRRPQLLLLDEPLGALDALTRLNMQALLSTLCDKYQPATLLVTHDVDEALLLADRVLVLKNGTIANEVIVASPRPRSGSKDLEALRSNILSLLGVTPAGANELGNL